MSGISEEVYEKVNQKIREFVCKYQISPNALLLDSKTKRGLLDHSKALTNIEYKDIKDLRYMGLIVLETMEPNTVKPVLINDLD